MLGEVEAEAPRARPLSGGLWTLFSWLRRDERASSTDSLSSAGSARTAASFAFLPPTNYSSPNPLVLPPLGPPTDSYKKRLKDRNSRRHHERDLTLHRKYGLHRGEESYVSSLPVRAGGWCRAASEDLPRRPQHVPGKRRAPPPPAAQAATIPRRSRKRPAPQPPVLSADLIKENFKSTHLNSIKITKQMNDSRSLPSNEISTDCKSEKYKKKDTSKDTKPKSDRSFLKQLFDNRKRNSAIDTSSVKILPSISELDKQAAEIIESCKQKALERNSMSGVEQSISRGHSASSNGEAWFCTGCLRKYNFSVKTCLYCLPYERHVQKSTGLQKDTNSKITTMQAASTSTQTEMLSNATSPNSALDEKQKLKVMLKQMKDSLPKRPKHDNSEMLPNNLNMETPTLRIGSSVMKTEDKSEAQTASQKPFLKREEVPSTSKTCLSFKKSVIVTQPVVLTHVVAHLGDDKQGNSNKSYVDIHKQTPISSTRINKNETETNLIPNTQLGGEKSKLHTPLKISTLLNPVYVPITSSSNKQSTTSKEPINLVKSDTKIAINSNVVTTSNVLNKENQHNKRNDAEKQQALNIETANKSKETVASSSRSVPKAKLSNSLLIPSDNSSSIPNNVQEPNDIVERLDRHARRRDLVNQLEKSIAGGDERAAAEAAVKLAQLRLSCSVLSFSSQIVGEPSTSSSIQDKKNSSETKTHETSATNKPTTSKIIVHALPSVEPESDKGPTQKIDPSSRFVKPTVLPTHHKNYEKNNEINKCVQVKPSTSKQAENKNDDMVSIVIWIEDKEAARGPVNLRIQRQAVVGDLRKQAEMSLGLDARLQRWIVGRALCTNDNTPLENLAGANFKAPFYLCLVESDSNADSTLPVQVIEEKKNNQIGTDEGVYTELMKLEQQAVVPNTEAFECDVCMEECVPNRGVVLRECVHTFCTDCLADVIRHSEEPVVTCPAAACPGVLQEREIRALVSPEEYERWLARGLAAAESGTRNAFHCRTRDCTGWALCEPGVRQFPCPVCKRTNCVPCQAIHEGETCEQHRAKLEEAAKATDSNVNDASTRALLDTLIKKGEALECPECSAIITKKWGCDWVKCSACKTEICWVTRGRRWGPNGRGDSSAGCRCGVDGKRCHPSCGYCH